MKQLPPDGIASTRLLSEDAVSLAFYQQPSRERTFVFQHGLGGDYQQCLEAFPDSEHWGIASLECRAHGSSDAGDLTQISIERYANDLIAVMQAQLAAPVAIGGISMGAAIALRIAAIRPDLVSALVLVRPAWALAAAPANMQPNRLVGELIEQYPRAEALERFKDTDTYTSLEQTSPDNLASLMSFFDRTDAQQFARVLQAIANDGPNIDDKLLDDWSIPTLVMATPDDLIHPPELAESLAKRLCVDSVVQLPAKYNNKPAYLQALREHLRLFLESTM